MKTNLVKILALSAMVLSLGACGNQGGSQGGSESSSKTEEIPVVTISEILDLDANYHWALEGQKVTIEHLALQGRYGNTIIGGTALGTSVTTLRGLEIDCAEFPTFEKGSGWGADISATGTVADVNGRAVLADAVVTVNSERDYDNPPADGSAKYSGGLSISYWPAQYMDRGSFDTYLGRGMSGIMFGGVFQIASMPEAVTEQKGTTFEVVFPGEYADVEDPDNLSLITVTVPDGIGATGVQKFNEFFADKVVGNFVDITGLGQYDSVNNAGGYGILLESFAAQDCVTPNPLPTVYTQWAQVAAQAQPYYFDALPDLSADKAFTYKVNLDYVTYGLDELFNDTSFIKVPLDSVFVEFDLIGKPSDIAEVFGDVCDGLEAAGFVEDTAEEGASIYVLYDGDDAIAQADVFNQDSYVEVDYMGAYNSEEFATLAAALATIELRADSWIKYLDDTVTTDFVSAVPTALEEATEKGAVVDYFYETYYLGYYASMGLIMQYNVAVEVELAEGKTIDDVLEAYETAVLSAAFEEKLLLGVSGYFNATTNVFVAFGGSKTTFQLSIMVLDDVSKDQVKPPYKSDADLLAAYNEYLLETNGMSSTYFPAQETKLPASFTVGEVEAVGWDLDLTYAYYYIDQGAPIGYAVLSITYPEGTNMDDIITGYTAALGEAGFVAATSLPPFSGEYPNMQNAVSGECVEIEAKNTTLVLSITICFGYMA